MTLASLTRWPSGPPQCPFMAGRGYVAVSVEAIAEIGRVGLENALRVTSHFYFC
jgi:hypothetical protein